MTTGKEYREFADECLRSATEAESEKERQLYLDMARDWTLAAIRAEGLAIPSGEFEVDNSDQVAPAKPNGPPQPITKGGL
jgi:hypothetical protein